MKVIKKNQLAILVISLMLITAGYLNYGTNYNSKAGMEASTGLEEQENVNLAALGDAELVNANNTEENSEEVNNGLTEEQKNSEQDNKTRNYRGKYCTTIIK